MYKNASKYEQRFSNNTGHTVSDTLPTNIKKTPKREKKFALTKKNKKIFLCCEICGQLIQRTTNFIKSHYFKTHKIKLNEAESFRLATNKLKSKASIEDFKKPFEEVSGGLPSLGKHRR